MAVNKSFIVKNGLQVADSAVIGGPLVASGLEYPTSDGNSDEILKTNGAGVLTFRKLRLNDLQNVDIVSFQEGGLLIYDSAEGKWKSNNATTVVHKNYTDGGFY